MCTDMCIDKCRCEQYIGSGSSIRSHDAESDYLASCAKAQTLNPRPVAALPVRGLRTKLVAVKGTRRRIVELGCAAADLGLDRVRVVTVAGKIN